MVLRKRTNYLSVFIILFAVFIRITIDFGIQPPSSSILSLSYLNNPVTLTIAWNYFWWYVAFIALLFLLVFKLIKKRLDQTQRSKINIQKYAIKIIPLILLAPIIDFTLQKTMVGYDMIPTYIKFNGFADFLMSYISFDLWGQGSMSLGLRVELAILLFLLVRFIKHYSDNSKQLLLWFCYLYTYIFLAGSLPALLASCNLKFYSHFSVLTNLFMLIGIIAYRKCFFTKNHSIYILCFLALFSSLAALFIKGSAYLLLPLPFAVVIKQIVLLIRKTEMHIATIILEIALPIVFMSQFIFRLSS